MSIINLLKELKEKGITVRLEDNNLKIAAEKGQIDSELLQKLKDNKEGIIAFLKGQTGIKTPSDFTFSDLSVTEYQKLLKDNGLTGYEVEDVYTLSPLQKGFLFHSLMDQKSTAYFEQMAIDIKGNLNVDLTHESWKKVSEKYEVLRTMVIGDFRIPIQIILNNRSIEFSYIDLRNNVNKAIAIEEIKEQDRSRTFNLKKDHLFRVKLIQIEEGDFTLLISFHHIILDGWCSSILFSEFTEIYNKLSNGQNITLDKAPKYANYITWLDNINKEKSKKYWNSYLEGYTNLASIPQCQTTSSKEQSKDYIFQLSKVETNSLEELARKQGVTLNSIVQTIWAIILSSYNNTNDIVFGSTVSGRPQNLPDVESMVGLFINSIPVRVNYNSESSFADVLKTVYEDSISSLPHHYTSLSDIQSDSGIHNSLLDHIMVFENYPMDESLGDSSSSLFEVTKVEAFEQMNYDFGIMIYPGPQLGFCLKYNPAKYDFSSMERIASHIKTLTTEILLNIDKQINDLNMVSKEERNLLINSFNDTKAKYPVNKSVIDLFEEQALKNPDKNAINWGDISLTYGELDNKATALGQYLKENYKIGINDLVGIYLTRSEKWLVTLLGILKTGAGFLPVDPEYPKERVDYMLSDSNLKLLISTKEVVEEKVISFEGSKLLLDEADIQYIPGENTIDKENRGDSSNLLYAIYTSGSTGQPKGVMLRNQNLVNLISFTAEKTNISFKGNRILQFASLSFDVCYQEIFSTLLLGGELFLTDETTRKAPDLLFKFIEDNNISILFLPTAYFKFIFNDQEYIKGVPSTLEHIIVAGEQLTVSSLVRKTLKDNNIYLHNHYGPSETHVVTTLTIDCSEEVSEIPSIGSPIQNTGVYILDSQCNLKPIGVPGELCIGGDNVGKGYLNKPDLTKEKFIDNPYVPGDIIYKTGDLARWQTDGNIEFLGRIDDQVKIRGFRIELGEIENTLIKHEEIEAASVIVKEQNDKILVAYYVSENQIDVKDIRDFLSITLPDYMIPSFFMNVDSIPLTPNGKVDKKKLPEIKGALVTGNKYEEPTNETERILVEIWQDVLGVDIIGIADNFFELGGNSIKAISIVSKINQKLNLNIELKTLFTNPVIKELARVSNSSSSEALKLPKIEINEDDLYKPFPLTDVQQAYWIGRSDLYDLGNVGTHVYCEFYFPELDIQKLSYSLNFLIKRHEMLRMVISDDGQQFILKDTEPYEIKILDLRDKIDLEGNELFLELRDELSHQVFTGEEWPLFDIRVTIFKDGGFKVHYSMDALLMDSSSISIFFNELITVYLNKENELPPINITFRDYVLGEQKIKESALFTNSKNYWQERLNSLPGKPELPLAVTPSEINSPKFERKEFFLNKEEWEPILNKIKSVGVTPAVFFIEVFGQIINNWSTNNNFLLNLTLFNRIPLHEDIDRIIGDFTSLTLLEMNYNEPESFSNQLKRTQTKLWDDLEHKYYTGVEVQRDLSRVTGETVFIPVVITSTLGILGDDNIIEDLGDIDKNLSGIEEDYSITQTSQVWLDYKIMDYEGGIGVQWDYVHGLFNNEMINDMFQSFSNLIKHFGNDGSNWNLKVPLLTPDKHLKIREKINNTNSEISNKLMHEMFIENVNKRSDKIAIRSRNKNLTYKELYNLASTLGSRLVDLGATPNKLIAIVMDKGWEQVAAALAIQISGAAYLPIDASFPLERIDSLLEIGDVDTVVTTSTVLERVKSLEIPNIECIDNISLSEEKDFSYIQRQNSEDLAYVIFTSGSTGEPKGVMIDHRGAVNTILDINKRFNITEDDSCFAISSLSFDLSVYDIFGLLAAGGSIVIPEPGETKDPSAWLTYLKDSNVTVWNSVPALMQMLVEYTMDMEISLNFKRVLLSGDWIPLSLPDRIKELSPDSEVISLGGATEASIWSIYYPIDEINNNWKSIPYGKPLKNQTFHVLQKDLSPCPDYVAGGLYIGGIGLSMGYWKDNSKTNSSFIIHPQTGDRLYKTGDIGRYLGNGIIEFLGRDDSQVKIQGYRIELGEIEETLKKHPLIDQCVVDARELSKGKQLVAYIKPMETNFDGVGELANSGNTIKDENERAAFKLERRGIRKLQAPSISLEINDKELFLIPKDHHTLEEGSITLEELSSLFQGLICKDINEQPLPKYYYPSAGSLYPVQVYVSIPETGVEGVEEGSYYFNPEDKKLYQVSNKAASSNVTISFIGNMDAIEPLYGKYAEGFCYMEAGYMAEILLGSLSSDLAIKEYKEFNNINSGLELSGSYVLLGAFHIGRASKDKTQSIKSPFRKVSTPGERVKMLSKDLVKITQTFIERKSYRSYSKDVIPYENFCFMFSGILNSSLLMTNSEEELDILISIKKNRVADLVGGLYQFDPNKIEFVRIGDYTELYSLFSGSESMYEESAFSIFVSGRDTNKGTAYSGIIGQSLMNYSTKRNIGLCAIGIVSDKIAQEIFNLDERDKIIHSFLGGYVTDEQINSITPIKNDRDPFDIKAYLREQLPEYMIPSHFLMVDDIPLTANGKINRKVLPDPSTSIESNNKFVAAGTGIEKRLEAIWKDVLGVQEIGIEDSFFELGGNSLSMVQISKRVNNEWNKEIPLVMFYTYTNIKSFSEYLIGEYNINEEKDDLKIVNNENTDIAIIGMSGRFPGATDLNVFLKNLREGRETISRFTEEELIDLGHDEELVNNPNYVKAFGILEDKEYFDANFFGYPPLDAESMNPQVRIFHEEAWRALEDAGYVPENYKGSIGIFAGGTSNTDWILSSILSDSSLDSVESGLLVDTNYLSTRVSHKLNLQGPSYYVDTACSTSIVNIAIAARELLDRNCDMALAGGITAGSITKTGYMYTQGSIFSPDGHCKSFSEDASGTVFGEGAGVVVLKRLDDAIRDKDNIQAVIKGFGTNNDGARKAGFTAPSVLGQAELLKDVQRRAGVDPESISYIEAHGTATVMGDPIELEALKMSFNTNKKKFCGIGSVKSNIGHLSSAAGIAAVIKTVLSLKNKQLFPTLHADAPNPHLNIEESPFYINNQLKDWDCSNAPLRAGVSSFGIGGTNAHIILEEAPESISSNQGKNFEIITISGKTKTAVRNNLKRLLEFLKDNRNINLGDVSYTLNTGRKHFDFRYSAAVSSIEELINKLDKDLSSNIPITRVGNSEPGKLAFMFPGQGSQYGGMASDLYKNEKVFREAVDSCIAILEAERGVSFKNILFNDKDINDSHNSSCAIFIIEYALTLLLRSRGIKPDVMIGHSLGEYTAACISGVLSIEDALKLIYDRGILVSKLPQGAMLTVFMTKDEIEPYLNKDISLALENSDQVNVLAGSEDAINELKSKIPSMKYSAVPFKSSHAFHSHMLEPILEEYKKLVDEIKFNKPSVPYISNVTGCIVKGEEVTNGEYWINHFRNSVKFNTGIKELLNGEYKVFLEVGPGISLSSLVDANPLKEKSQIVLNTIKHTSVECDDSLFLQKKISQLWLNGVSIDWDSYYREEERRRISLPTYAFDKTYFGQLFNGTLNNRTFLNNQLKEEIKTYIPDWKETEDISGEISDKVNYLLFSDELGVADKLRDKLSEDGNSVVSVNKGEEFIKSNNNEFTIDYRNEEHYTRLFKELQDNNFVPEKLIHSWSINGYKVAEVTLDSFYKEQELGFYSAINIVKSLETINRSKHLDIYFLSDNMQSVDDLEKVSPEKSTILGAVNVIKQEYTDIDSFSIDVIYKDILTGDNKLLQQIIDEISIGRNNSIIAFRNGKRLVPDYKTIVLDEEKDTIFKSKGVYFITGGLGGLGLTIAQNLAEKDNVKLILSSRKDFPSKDEWDKILNVEDPLNYKSKIKAIQNIENLGSEVYVLKGDAASYDEMKELVKNAESLVGEINGVIHTAGVMELAPLGLNSIVDVKKTFMPKIDGAIVLNKIFKDKKLDFMLYCSSIASLAGGLGMSVYSAANQFLNSIAEYQSQKVNYPVISAIWPGWKGIGMHRGSEDNHSDDMFKISSDDGCELLDIITKNSYPCVIPYRKGLNSYIRKTRFIGRSEEQSLISEENFVSRPDLSTEYVAPEGGLENKLVEIWKKLLGIEQIGVNDKFFEMGGSSLKLIKLAGLLKDELNIKISVPLLFTYTTIQSLADYINNNKVESFNVRENKNRKDNLDSIDIAVIGMSGRFSEAENISEYYNSLKEGKELITHFTKDELLEIGMNKDQVNNPNYIKSSGMLKDKECFDAGFFGYSPSDAEYINPQTRYFHEDVWAALEDGGYNPEEYSGSIGLFAGASTNLNWLAGSFISGTSDSGLEIGQLAEPGFMCTRVSYKLNLRGPSYFTDTACSSSLVNIVNACENLVNDRCDMALAGGVCAGSETKLGYWYSEGSIFSPDGHCKAFSSEAAGTVFGEGSGVILLKRLDDAIRDRDNIHGVIKGFGTNNDGNRKMGYSAPSIIGQAELIQDVQQRAGVDPESITYIEAHGTGTDIGDPIEVEALKMAFNSDKKNFCGIGSVKSSIGHLNSAAGVSSVIKTVLSLKNKQLFPSLHVDEVNPLLELEDSPFYINTELKDWEIEGNPRRAGVSSFGMGGTNAHIIMEEAPELEKSSYGKKDEIINISGRTESALKNNAQNLVDFLKNNREINLSDISYTLNTGRKHFDFRCSITASNVEELISKLDKRIESGLPMNRLKKDNTGKIVFMFPGQGSQYVKMGWDLYEQEAVFKEELDKCIKILKDRRDVDFYEVLFSGDELNDSHISSCAIFMVEYSLSKYLETRGISPDIMIGHSLGEYSAACLSGVISLEDTLTLLYDRGLLVQTLSKGSMLSVFMSKEEILPLLNENISLALENGENVNVIAGSEEAIEEFKMKVPKMKYSATPFKSSHAFHSHMLDPVLDDYRKILEGITFNAPLKTYISNVTGKIIKKEEVCTIDYWLDHFRQSVKFNSGLQLLMKHTYCYFVEVGPGISLSSLVDANSLKRDEHCVLNTIRHPSVKCDDTLFIQKKISQLWLRGANINWDSYYKGEKRRRVSLPTYAFDKTKYGKLFNFMLKSSNLNLGGMSSSDGILTHLPSWERVEIPRTVSTEVKTFLVFADDIGVSEKVKYNLVNDGHAVIEVKKGEVFKKVDEHSYVINYRIKEDYKSLLNCLEKSNNIPEHIIHGWTIIKQDFSSISLESIEEVKDLALYSPFYFVNCLDDLDQDLEVKIHFLSCDVQEVNGLEELSPANSLILAPSKIIPAEFPQMECFNIDFTSSELKSLDKIAQKICNEIFFTSEDYQVAYRRGFRWILRYKSIDLEQHSDDIKVKDNGLYLIPGGLGGMGLTFSKLFADEFNNPKLILTTRRDFPERSKWEDLLEADDQNRSKENSQIRKLMEIEKAGADIWICKADISNKTEMEDLVRNVEEEWGFINGIIHAAGPADGKMMKLRNKSDIEVILQSKLTGTLILHDIFKDKKLDFVIYCSSLASISGEIGHFAYTAANQFLDSFASRLRSDGYPATSINWTAWDDVGMLTETDRFIKEEEIEGCINSATGAELLKQVLQTDFSTVAISKFDINDFIKANIEFNKKESGVSSHDVFQARPDLSSEYEAPSNEVEKTLVSLWENLSGIVGLGINDDFFELGGDSLKGLRVISSIQKCFDVRLTINNLYTLTTIKKLANFIDDFKNITATDSEVSEMETEREVLEF